MFSLTINLHIILQKVSYQNEALKINEYNLYQSFICLFSCAHIYLSDLTCFNSYYFSITASTRNRWCSSSGRNSVKAFSLDLVVVVGGVWGVQILINRVLDMRALLLFFFYFAFPKARTIFSFFCLQMF